MTVGIGVMCEDGDCVVLASDLRVTYGKMKVTPHERAGKQYDFPPFNLAACIAGSPSSTHAIVSEFSGQLRNLIEAWIRLRKDKPEARIYFEHIRNALEFARKRELRRLQTCAMETDLGLSLRDWLKGKLPTGESFNEYAHKEGLRVLRRVKEDMYSKTAVIVGGFLRDEAVFCRALGALPVEESVTPAIFVIGGKGAVEAQQVLINRNQSIEMGIARTLLHVYEALKAARSDKGVGDPCGYVVIRPHTKSAPNGVLRFHSQHPILKKWSKEYALRDTEPLESRFANDMINGGMTVATAKRSQWLGPRSVMREL